MADNKQEMPEDIQKQVRANVLMMKAADAYEVGEYDEAIRLLKEATAIVPENASLWFELAKGYRETGDYDGEIECYKKMIEAQADDGQVWLNMALAYRVMGKLPEEMYSLVMAADKGTEIAGSDEEKAVIVDRYKELLAQRVQARNPLSLEDRVPVYNPDTDEAPDQATCMVCFQKIDKKKQEGQVLMCPHCRRVGHFLCLASWLQTPSNQICPVCHGMLDFSLENYDMREALGIGKRKHPENTDQGG
ncbi:MAG: tetratricopeptide repeat protein [Candidatus Lokiarchaeota archaeon]|nr:tetratricopeptide repeat protein [Candidatus Lokiarchaeota archaeon]